jgi:hypothetical protein
MSKMTETQMVKNMVVVLGELSPVEFVELYNQQYGACYTVDEINWDWDGIVPINTVRG